MEPHTMVNMGIFFFNGIFSHTISDFPVRCKTQNELLWFYQCQFGHGCATVFYQLSKIVSSYNNS